MTLVLTKDTVCTVCKTANAVPDVVTVSAGATSLRGVGVRTPLHTYVQECVSCGLCARELRAPPARAATTIASPRYREIHPGKPDSRIPSTARLARLFECASYVAEQCEDWETQGWFSERAGYARLIMNEPEAARLAFQAAADAYERRLAQGIILSDGRGASAYLLADLRRCAGQWREALDWVVRSLGGRPEAHLRPRLHYIAHLARAHDPSVRTLEDATKWISGLSSEEKAAAQARIRTDAAEVYEWPPPAVVVALPSSPALWENASEWSRRRDAFEAEFASMLETAAAEKSPAPRRAAWVAPLVDSERAFGSWKSRVEVHLGNLHSSVMHAQTKREALCGVISIEPCVQYCARMFGPWFVGMTEASQTDEQRNALAPDALKTVGFLLLRDLYRHNRDRFAGGLHPGQIDDLFQAASNGTVGYVLEPELFELGSLKAATWVDRMVSRLGIVEPRAARARAALFERHAMLVAELGAERPSESPANAPTTFEMTACGVGDLPSKPIEILDDSRDLETQGSFATHLPFVVLVFGDLTQRADPRAIEDRTPIALSDFAKTLQEHRLSVEVELAPLGGVRATICFRRLSDFSPDAVAAQIAAVCKVEPAAAARCVSAVLSDPRVASLEQTWRGVHFLSARVGDGAIVEVLNVSIEDLRRDLHGAADLTKSGLNRIVHRLDHFGMRPYGALVFADLLDGSLLRPTSEIARLGRAVAIVDAHAGAPTSAGDGEWQRGEAAKHVAQCSPSFVQTVERPGAFRSVFVGAACMLESRASTGLASRFASIRLPGLQTLDRDAPSRDNTLSFSWGSDGVTVERDEPCHVDGLCSLTGVLFGNELAHQVANIQWRKRLVPETCHASLVAAINRGLIARLWLTGIEATAEVVGREIVNEAPSLQLTVTIDEAPRQFVATFPLWRDR